MTATERPAGFTLLELIVSLTILGVIVTIVYGAMNVGVRAWEKGEGDVEGRQRCRIVLDRMAQQLASMVIPRDPGVGDAAPYLLKGDAAAVEFISRIPLHPANRSGPVQVAYEVREDGEGVRSLVCREQSLASLSPASGETSDGADMIILLPQVAECRFEYFRVSEAADDGKKAAPAAELMPEVLRRVAPLHDVASEGPVLTWEATWDGDAEQQNPRAVGIYLQAESGADPIRVIVPLHGGDEP